MVQERWNFAHLMVEQMLIDWVEVLHPIMHTSGYMSAHVLDMG